MSIEYLANIIRKRLRNDYDIVVAITGEVGDGKSTFAVQLGMAIDHNFTLEKNVSFFPDPNRIIHEYAALKRYSVYLLDEAVRATYKLDWQSKLQQSLVKMYNTERWQNKCTLLCIPNFWDLAKSFRNHRVKIWIHIMERGYAFVYMKDKDKDIEDVWHLKETLNIKSKAFRRAKMTEVELGKRMQVERKLPTYFADFKFPDLPEDIKEKYIELKIKSREGLLEGEQTKDPLWRRVSKNFIWEMKVNHKKTTKEVAAIGGCGTTSVTVLLGEKRRELKRKQLTYVNKNNKLVEGLISAPVSAESDIVQ